MKPPDAAHGWEIAQINVARPVAPLTEPELAWFVRELRTVNARADAAPGFRWRLQSDAGDATSIPVFEDPALIVNLSVWASVEDLRAFVYRDPAHVAVLRRRRDGFTPLGRAHQALWWVPAGHRPDVREAERRLEHLREHGPGPWSFTLAVPFPPPSAGAGSGAVCAHSGQETGPGGRPTGRTPARDADHPPGRGPSRERDTVRPG